MFDEALIKIDKALLINPNDALACSNKGYNVNSKQVISLLLIGMFNDAMKIYDKALKPKFNI